MNVPSKIPKFRAISQNHATSDLDHSPSTHHPSVVACQAPVADFADYVVLAAVGIPDEFRMINSSVL